MGPTRLDSQPQVSMRARIATDVAARAVGNPAGFAGITVEQVAQVHGLHVTTARFHLKHLVDNGEFYVERERVGVGRPRNRYFPTTRGLDSLRRLDFAAYQVLATILAHQHTNQPLSPEAAGEAWALDHSDDLLPGGDGGDAAADLEGRVARIVEVMRSSGYAPDTRPEADGFEVVLGNCPVRQLARETSTVTCAVHRGLLRGMMTAQGGGDSVVDLVPFADGTTCLARFHPAAAAAASATGDEGAAR
ncbi:MAG: helix-turn-helix transcriptional regulator [Arachnia sp.]